MTGNRTGPAVLLVRATVPDRGLEVDLQVPDGQVVAVLGPNGAGKSTLLALVAGLLRPDAGRIELGGRVVADASEGAWVPAHTRGVALLAQQALLFPHLSVLANVAFGPRSQGRSRAEANAAARAWLTEVDAAEFADRSPAELSGGQAQRVAIARAMAAEPAVLLLDEPMAALDVGVAPAIRQVLRRVLRARPRTTLLVTHDVLDALALADRVIVLDGGRVVEDGPVREVLTRPRSAFGARIAGVNLVAGVSTPTGLQAPGFALTVAAPLRPPGQDAVALFSPSAVAVHLAEPTGSPRNHLPVTVAELEPRGETVRVRAEVDGGHHPTGSTDTGTGAGTVPFGNSGSAGGPAGGPADPGGADGSSPPRPVPILLADITVAAAADLDLAPGMRVWFTVKATEVTVHPAAGTTVGSGTPSPHGGGTATSTQAAPG